MISNVAVSSPWAKPENEVLDTLRVNLSQRLSCFAVGLVT